MYIGNFRYVLLLFICLNERGFLSYMYMSQISDIYTTNSDSFSADFIDWFMINTQKTLARNSNFFYQMASHKTSDKSRKQKIVRFFNFLSANKN